MSHGSCLEPWRSRGSWAFAIEKNYFILADFTKTLEEVKEALAVEGTYCSTDLLASEWAEDLTTLLGGSNETTCGGLYGGGSGSGSCAGSGWCAILGNCVKVKQPKKMNNSS